MRALRVRPPIPKFGIHTRSAPLFIPDTTISIYLTALAVRPLHTGLPSSSSSDNSSSSNSNSNNNQGGMPSHFSLASPPADTHLPSHLGLSLRKVAPYWWNYSTSTKRRWVGRELLEVYTNEFRDRTKEYYLWAIHQGLCTVNGARASPRHVFRMNDHLVNKVHLHEPPVTAEPIRIVHRDDKQGRLVVVKPGSVPVHSVGRYHHNTLLEMLQHETGLPKIYTSNRLDRLTSGVMVLSTTPAAAREITQQFRSGSVRKYYVARVQGTFPDGRITCTEPILPVDAQAGVNIVHPLGRPCETVFERLSYDAETDTSVVKAQPITGRTHQIRVHCQYLGHPIANDPLYGHDIWAAFPAASMACEAVNPSLASHAGGSGSTGSAAVDAVIAAIKEKRDTEDDWARWKDEVLFKRLLEHEGHEIPAHIPGPNAASSAPRDAISTREQILSNLGFSLGSGRFIDQIRNEQVQGICHECCTPLLPDPDPESLFIYLHAYHYASDSWSYEDKLPWWAHDGWQVQMRDARHARAEAARRGTDDAVVFTPPPQCRSAPPSHFESPSQRSMPGAASLLQGSARGWTDAYLDPLTAGGLTDQERQELGGLSRLRLDPGYSRLVERELDLPAARDALPPLVPCPTALAFSVFPGLEDVAERDLQRVLRSYSRLYGVKLSDSENTLAFLHSGQVAVPPSQAATLLLRAWIDGRIRSANGASLVVCEAEFPRSLARRLVLERQALGRTSEQAKKFKRGNKAKSTPTLMDLVGGLHESTNSFAAGTAAGTAATSSNASDDKAASSEVQGRLHLDEDLRNLPLPEADMVQLVRQSWHSHDAKAHRDVALETWGEVRAAQGKAGPAPTARDGHGTPFKVSFDRGGYLLPTLRSPSVNPLLGETVWSWLNPGVSKGDPGVTWPVQLTTAELVVHLNLVPNWLVRRLHGPSSTRTSWSPDDVEALRRMAAEPMTDAATDPPSGAVFISLELPQPLVVAGRPELEPEVFGGGTLLRPDRAYLLAGLACLPTTSSDGKGTNVLEPCTGWGRIPAELRQAFKDAGVENASIFASDIDPDSVARTEELLRRTQTIGLEVKTYTHLLDATKPEPLGRWIAGEHVPDAEGQTRQMRLGAALPTLQHYDGRHAHKMTHYDTGQGLPAADLSQADVVITDLPWGQRVMSSTQLRRFYRALLPSLLAVLKPGGRAVLMTAQYAMLDRIITDFGLVQAGKPPQYDTDRQLRTQAQRERQEWTLEKSLLALPPVGSPDAQPSPQPVMGASDPLKYQYTSAESDGHMGIHAIGYEYSPARAQGVRNAEQHGGYRTAKAGYVVAVMELRKVKLPAT